MRYCVAFAFAICSVNVAFAVPIHFLVAEPPQHRVHDDSYVIVIDSADDARLNHARALFGWIDSGADPASSPGAAIVVANILAGGDGINRNVFAPGEPVWSWRIAGQIEFTDVTIEILDGTPTMVEQDIDAWLANTNSTIGFWGYTVVAELGVVPEPTTMAFPVAFAPFLFQRSRRNDPSP